MNDLAEVVNEDATVRAKLRKLFETQATIQSKVIADKETEAIKYKDYFDFNGSIFALFKLTSASSSDA